MDTYPKLITIGGVDYTVTSKDHEASTRHDPSTGTVAPAFKEYPKHITIQGTVFTAESAEHEAELRSAQTDAATVTSNVELVDPAPHKKATGVVFKGGKKK